MRTSTVKEIIKAAEEGKTVRCNRCECRNVVGKLSIKIFGGVFTSEAGDTFAGKIMHEGNEAGLILLTSVNPHKPLYYEEDDIFEVEILD